MVALIVRHDGGGTAVLGTHRVGEILFGGTALPEWRKLDAALVPYATSKSAGIPNVAVALDTMLTMARDLEGRISSVEIVSNKTDRGHDEILTEVRTQLAELGRHVAKTATRLSAASHAAVRVTRVSNPALSIDPVMQELKLDLAATGSYSDLYSQSGQTSIQGAVETAYAEIRKLSDSISVLQTQVAQMNAEIIALRDR